MLCGKTWGNFGLPFFLCEAAVCSSPEHQEFMFLSCLCPTLCATKIPCADDRIALYNSEGLSLCLLKRHTTFEEPYLKVCLTQLRAILQNMKSNTLLVAVVRLALFPGPVYYSYWLMLHSVSYFRMCGPCMCCDSNAALTL